MTSTDDIADDTPSDIPAAILDLRPAPRFEHERPVGAVHFDLEDLEQRAYLLPPRWRPLTLLGDPETLQHARRILEKAERNVHVVEESEWRQQLPIETGPPSKVALWEPTPLVKQALQRFGNTLPGKRAVDVACGTGRNAVFLAQQGFRVTGIDWLPDALSRARDLAQRSDVDITTLHQDLERPGALAGMQADCLVVVRYLHRGLFPALIRCLVPGGLLIYETFTVEQKIKGHPRNPLFMLQPGELRKAFSTLDVLFREEDWHDGAHTSQLIARKPQSRFNQAS